MEILIMTDAMRRASAKSITAVMPYFGYARQDRKTRSRDPISSKLVANLLTCAGIDRILTMDLHCAQIQGFFDIPVDHLLGVNLFVEYFKSKIKNNLGNFVAVAPDFGSVVRTRDFAEKLNIPLAIINKRRPAPNIRCPSDPHPHNRIPRHQRNVWRISWQQQPAQEYVHASS